MVPLQSVYTCTRYDGVTLKCVRSGRCTRRNIARRWNLVDLRAAGNERMHELKPTIEEKRNLRAILPGYATMEMEEEARNGGAVVAACISFSTIVLSEIMLDTKCYF